MTILFIPFFITSVTIVIILHDNKLKRNAFIITRNKIPSNSYILYKNIRESKAKSANEITVNKLIEIREKRSGGSQLIYQS